LQAQITINELADPAAMIVCRSTQIGVEEIDLSTLTSFAELRTLAEPDLVVELIDLYLTDVPAQIHAIKAASARSDVTVLKQAAHTLKGSSTSIGFRQIAEICEQLERLDWRDSHNRLDALTELLQYRFARLRDALLTLRQVRLDHGK